MTLKMPPSSVGRLSVVLIAFLSLLQLMFQVSVLSATEPKDAEPKDSAPRTESAHGVLNFPDVPVPVQPSFPDDPAARQAISKVLQGESVVDSGHRLPDEIRELLHSTGSVLDGSSLDRDNIEPAVSPATSRGVRQAHAAEMLLKTARLLDKIEPASENRKQLVNQMRSEAVRILQQSIDTRDQVRDKSISDRSETDGSKLDWIRTDKADEP